MDPVLLERSLTALCEKLDREIRSLQSVIRVRDMQLRVVVQAAGGDPEDVNGFIQRIALRDLSED